MPRPNCLWAVRTAVSRKYWSVSASWTTHSSNCFIAEASSVCFDANCLINSFIVTLYGFVSQQPTANSQ